MDVTITQPNAKTRSYMRNGSGFRIRSSAMGWVILLPDNDDRCVFTKHILPLRNAILAGHGEQNEEFPWVYSRRALSRDTFELNGFYLRDVPFTVYAPVVCWQAFAADLTLCSKTGKPFHQLPCSPFPHLILVQPQNNTDLATQLHRPRNTRQND